MAYDRIDDRGSAVADDQNTIIERLFRRDPDLLADPYPAYRRLLEEGPIVRLDGPPNGPPWVNAWHIFAYQEIADGLRDHRFSSVRPMAGMSLERFGIDPETPEARFFWSMQAQTMLTMNAPDHTRLRALSLKAFTPRVVEGMRDTIHDDVNQLLDRAESRADATFDVMASLASPLPAIVIARLLGIPSEDWPRFKRWSDGLIGFNITQEKIENFYTLGQYLLARIAERRRNPADDLISGLIAAHDQDDALSEEELVGQCVILLVGGHETTTFALGNAVYRLLSDPALWARLPDIPIEGAVEELLRFDSPFQALSRRAQSPMEISDQQIAAGDTVWFWIAAGNHDPTRFSDPETLNLERMDNRHLSFGMGPHYCLGAALARLELHVALSTLRTRYPSLRLTTDGVAWKQDGAIRGPALLPLRTS